MKLLDHGDCSLVAFLGEALFNLDGTYRTVGFYAETEHYDALEFLFLCDGRINEVLSDECEECTFAAGVGGGHFYDGVIYDFFFLGRN